MKHNKTVRMAVPRQSYAAAFAAAGFLSGCLLALRLECGLWLLLIAVMCVPLCFLLRSLGRRGYAAVFLCMLALGAYRAGAALTPPAPDDGSYEVHGFISGETTIRGNDRATFTMANISLNGKPVPGKAYCSHYFAAAVPELYDGAEVSFKGRIYTPESKSGEPHFDFRTWMYSNGMSFGITAPNEFYVLNTKQTAPIMDAAYRIRSACSDALKRTMGEGSRLAMAMLFSEREGMSDDENEAFRTLGAAHILSVSGLHVGLLCGILTALLTALGISRRVRVPIIAVLLIGYCALTGFSAASVRAAVTLILMLCAGLLGRKHDPLITISAAMLIVLAINPLQAYSAGFALSFSAVISIMLLYPALSSMIERVLPGKSRRRGGRSLASRGLARLGSLIGTPRRTLALSLAAQLGVLVPTAVFFNSLPLYGIAINLIAVPCAALLVPLFLTALVLSPVPIIGMWIGAAAGKAGELFLLLIGLLSRLPYASVSVPTLPAAVVCAAAACIAVFSRRARGGAVRRVLVVAVCAVIGFGGAWLTRPPETRYIQLAVGQADAALLFDKSDTVVIDTGDDGTAVADYLRYYGRDIDALILTHLHYDHVGGVAHLLDSGVKIGRAYIPLNADRQRVDQKSMAMLDLIKERGIPVETLACGDELRYSDTVLRVLWPDKENVRSGQNANELPLVMAIDMGSGIILEASDLTGDYERYAAVPCDVLKVAHHGSRDSTGDDFLRRVSPSAALISCSSSSRSLPGAELLERLESHGIPYARTDKNGDITIYPTDRGLVIMPYKARMSE